MTDIIEYDALLSFLKEASLFEIYRLSVAIGHELEDPTRIALAKAKLKVGEVVEYFDSQTNNFISARVLATHLKYVSVINCANGERWRLPYHLFKIDSREFAFSRPDKGLNKHVLKVGNRVGFNHKGEEIVGQIERLNQKTVSLKTNTGQQWRVGYKSLYEIIEGEIYEAQAIEHQIL